MQKHVNTQQIGRHMSDWFPEDYTFELAQHWVTRGHIDFGGSNWAIAFEDEAVGGAGIHPQAGQFRCNVEIGYWLSVQHWGKGVGTAVVRLLTNQAFANTEVTRVFAPIHAHNAASQRICEKNGFVFEGLQRLSAMKRGQAIDRVNWATYRDIWFSTQV
jgi:[ribosomal protein S5]-alanine N-acetyltransferase